VCPRGVVPSVRQRTYAGPLVSAVTLAKKPYERSAARRLQWSSDAAKGLHRPSLFSAKSVTFFVEILCIEADHRVSGIVPTQCGFELH
jgi:hypothetical protein